ncbi:MAG: fibronectin type III domain-containing protein [Propionibacteriaceae bacterium]|nr:fibronectin type III domain-containing protein [Propionibacteriaceae bacterium]
MRRPHWQQGLSVGVGVALAAGLVVGAVIHPGMTIQQVDLNDSGVWVSNLARHVIGRINHQAGQIDGVAYPSASNFDLLQDQESILVTADGGSAAELVDPSLLTIDPAVTIGAGAQLLASDDRAVILAPNGASSSLWLLAPAAVAAFAPDAQATPPLINDLPANAEVALGADDTVYLLNPADASLTTIPASQPLAASVSNEQSASFASDQLDDVDPDGAYSMTVVGDTPVIFSADSGMLWLGSDRSIPAEASADQWASLTLQQPSAQAFNGAVIYTTSSDAVAQPLDGSSPIIHQIAADPDDSVARPTASAVVGGCAYSVWAGTGDFWRDCAGDDADSTGPVTSRDGQANGELRLRVNRDLVVLNQIDDGAVWLVSDEIIQVDNWDDAMASQEGDSQDDSDEQTTENTPPDRSADNQPPTAVDDAYGLRLGATALLPVVENDLDPDGDLLTVAPISGLPDGVSASLVYAGSIIQLQIDPTFAAQSLAFDYTIDDGRGGTDSARVTIDVQPTDQTLANRAPQPISGRTANAHQVAAGESISFNLLTDWRDPDGDPIFLFKAGDPAAVAAGDYRISLLPDGSLTYSDSGKTIGPKSIPVTISDGLAYTEGTVDITVLAGGSHPPLAVSDLLTGPINQDLLIEPLANDSDTDGDSLRLAGVSQTSGPSCQTVVASAEDGTVTLNCSQAGTVYLLYTISDGPNSADGLIRVEIIDPDDQLAPPLVVPDQAFLLTGQDVVVPVLDNDVNPLGYPLVVTGVTTDSPAVSVSVINHVSVKITYAQSFAAPITVHYTASNGPLAASSIITVIPVLVPESPEPPDGVDDTVTVRAGDIATVAVLANDTQANGLPLRLLPELAGDQPDQDSQALVFVAGNKIRVHARAAGNYAVLYQVANASGTASPDTAQLTIHVVPADGSNRAPLPGLVEARALAGSPVEITVPVDGIDPDGDFVELIGLASTPQAGVVTAIKGNVISYDPGETTLGSAQFNYRVRDRLGAIGEGTIRVGIAPANSDNHPPLAVSDQVEVRPGVSFAATVLDNDSDPEGDPINLIGLGEADFPAEIDNQQVALTAPTDPGDYVLTYTIDDGAAQATGILAIKVAPEVELIKPAPQDDVVTAAEVLAADTVTVDVLANDVDPDGDLDEAELTVDLLEAQVGVDGVTLPVTDELQIIDYYLTDSDGLVGHAFITIPGRASIPPQLNAAALDTLALTVKAGESVGVDLADYVLVRPDHQPLLTTAESLSAWHGTVSADSGSRLTFTAPVDYAGPAGISLEVTDGASVDDPDGLTAFLTIPVTVTAADGSDSMPPTLSDSTLNVEVGESADLALDRLAKNQEPDEALSFALVTKPAQSGLNAAVSGSTLTVSSANDLPKGSVDQLVVSVSDGANTPVEATITVTVVASTRPLPDAVDDQVAEAVQGQAVCLDVTANDFNPYPEEALTIVSAQVSGGQGTVDIGCAGSDQSVNITPAGDFSGQLLIRYAILDATHDVDRQAEGLVTLTVKGRPAAPSGLQLHEVGDRSVSLSWDPPNDHGATITAYTVIDSAGGRHDCGTATICTVDGLSNGVSYTFTVVASNQVGDSDPSAPSAEAVPDAIPSMMTAPGVKFADKALDISWVAPENHGTPIDHYQLVITGQVASGKTMIEVAAPATSTTWTGLTNGEPYQVQIRACNQAVGACQDPSQYSPLSVEQTPAGQPATPSTPEVHRLDPVGNQSQASVCWPVADGNGDPVSSYTLRGGPDGDRTITDAPQNGQVCAVVSSGKTGSQSQFSVIAHNKTTTPSDPSGQSQPFRFALPPGQVTPSASDGDGVCHVSWPTPNLNGGDQVTYYYQVQGNSGATGSVNGNQADVAVFNSNDPVTIEVWAQTKAASGNQGLTTIGNGPRGSTTCRPFGDPNPPSAKYGLASGEANSAAVIFFYDWPATNGRPIDRVECNVNGEGWQNPCPATGFQVDRGWGATISVEYKAFDSDGRPSASVFVSGRPHDEPKPWISISNRDASSFNMSWGNMAEGTFKVIMCRTPADGNNINGCADFGGRWFDNQWGSDNGALTNCNGGGTGNPNGTCWVPRQGSGIVTSMSAMGNYQQLFVVINGVKSNVIDWPY